MSQYLVMVSLTLFTFNVFPLALLVGSEVPKLWGAHAGGWAGTVCMRLIFNEIWAQDKIHISMGHFLDLNILLIS
jgi:hypothetical protein